MLQVFWGVPLLSPSSWVFNQSWPDLGRRESSIPKSCLSRCWAPQPPAIGAPTTTRPQYCGEGTGLNPVQTRNSSCSALRVSVWEAQTKIGVCNSQSLSLRTSDLKNESDPPNKRFKCILPMTYVFLLPSGPTRPDGSEMLPWFGRLCFSSGRTQCSLCRFLVLNLPSCQANSWKLSQGGPSCRPPFGFQDWHLSRSLQATILKSNQGQNSTSWPLYPSGWVTRSQQKVPCNGYSPGSGVLGVFSWRIHIQKHPKHSQTLLEANQFPPEPSGLAKPSPVGMFQPRGFRDVTESVQVCGSGQQLPPWTRVDTGWRTDGQPIEFFSFGSLSMFRQFQGPSRTRAGLVCNGVSGSLMASIDENSVCQVRHPMKLYKVQNCRTMLSLCSSWSKVLTTAAESSGCPSGALLGHRLLSAMNSKGFHAPKFLNFGFLWSFTADIFNLGDVCKGLSTW